MLHWIVDLLRASWYRLQLQGREHDATEAYAHYRIAADEFERQTGNTQYHAVNTVDEERKEFIRQRERASRY